MVSASHGKSVQIRDVMSSPRSPTCWLTLFFTELDDVDERVCRVLRKRRLPIPDVRLGHLHRNICNYKSQISFICCTFWIKATFAFGKESLSSFVSVT